MTRDQIQGVLDFAAAMAEGCFKADVAGINPPDLVWAELNRKYGQVDADGPTDVDRLFEAAFRSRMAYLWQREFEELVRYEITRHVQEGRA